MSENQDRSSKFVFPSFGTNRVKNNMDIFEQKLHPLISEIRRICEEHNMGMSYLIMFGTDDNEKTTYINAGSVMLGSEQEILHLKAVFEVARGSVKIMRGDQVVPPAITPMFN